MLGINNLGQKAAQKPVKQSKISADLEYLDLLAEKILRLGEILLGDTLDGHSNVVSLKSQFSITATFRNLKSMFT